MPVNAKININNCSLICVDCIDANRAIKSIEICKNKCQFTDVKFFTSLNFNYEHIIKIDTISSKKQYSIFMVKKLVDYIETDYVLIIQHDSWIINENAWDDNWYSYDYMGAIIPAWEDSKGGNGGFSFRSRRLIEYGKKIIPDNKCHPEDVAYSGPPSLQKNKGGYSFREEFEKNGFIFATNENNLKFARVHARKYRNSFGHHRAWGI
jgi:hypothetical protein